MGERRQLLLLAVGMTGAYVALGWLALLTTGTNEVTLMWPANGIVFAALLYFGPRWWPLPAVAVLLLHLTVSPVPPSFIPWSIASNVLGALAGIWFVRRFLPDFMERFDVQAGAMVLVGGLVFVVVSACFGAFGMWFSGQSRIEELFSDAVRWGIGDLYGIIAVTPAVLLGLLRFSRLGRVIVRDRTGYASIAEQRLWIGLTLLVVVTAAWLRSTEPAHALAIVGLPLAMLIWGAVRLPPFPVAVMNGVVSLLIVMAVSLGLAGPQPGTTLDAISLIVFLCVVAGIPMTLSLGTQQSRKAAARLLQRANSDLLTGLLNRSAFEYRARQAIQGASGEALALAYIDLDRFRLVNDATDHAVGDQLIRVVGGILRSELPASDVLARIGGDEFAVLMRGLGPDAALERANQLCAAVSQCRFQAGEHVATPTISIGLVPTLTGFEREYGGLLALADTACFAAKELGGNRVQCATVGARDVVQQSSDTMRWALRLGNAMEHDHFRLFCQSISPLRPDPDGLRHFEVLLRLKEPGSPLILPGQFIDAAERYAVSVQLDRYVVAKVLRWFERHPAFARQVGICAINLSAGSLQDEHFLTDLAAQVSNSILRPEQLCFELTETSALRDLGRAQCFIAAVRELGCRFALDDFGTGFCSFGYLRNLDVDFFKIDGSFVRDLDTSPLSDAIVRSIADIGRVMHKQTIAECVESEAIRRRLVELGVDYAQGFALARPTDIDVFFDSRQAIARIA